MEASSDYQFINRCLSRLGYTLGNAITFAKINAGRSGSNLYEIKLNDKPMILKYTDTKMNRDGRLRASREQRFYLDMSSIIETPIPELIGSFVDEQGGIGLLLKAYHQTPEPSRWNSELCFDKIRMIARLHAVFWNDASSLASFEWLTQKNEVVSTAAQNAAVQAWNEILGSMQRNTNENLVSIRQIEYMMGRLEDMVSLKHHFPRTLCHGDFHMENVLQQADNSPVISDWQEVCIASGPEDVSFFLQRASASGNPISSDAVIEVYTETVNDILRENLSIRSVRDVIDADKLHTMLVHWPQYLLGSSREVILGISSEMKAAASRLGFLPD
ncbi:aminoglycoside phosphotransferase family protein [Paenibacillus montanisoli]|uniref:Aminoglycoside phosphotransferase domain-containing protein n=1 Tax=Paenibacillus montanisoli TaxID=2081970 RepID=A0A328U0X9_9BACL|nr:aminoglycoside phosphotransferase family protein [Paenibacillus montanisoli]RAP75712.1 hypothetical protein DL346_09660 [Paenibacillus montanisoli]